MTFRSIQVWQTLFAAIVFYVSGIQLLHAQLTFDTRNNMRGLGVQSKLRQDWAIEITCLYDNKWGNPMVVKIISRNGPVKQNMNWTVTCREEYDRLGSNTQIVKNLVIPAGNDHGSILIDAGVNQSFEEITCNSGNIRINQYIDTWAINETFMANVEAILTFQAIIVQTDRFTYGSNLKDTPSKSVQRVLDRLKHTNTLVEPGAAFIKTTDGTIHPADFNANRTSKRSLGRYTTTVSDLSKMSQSFPEKFAALRKAIEGGTAAIILCDTVDNATIEKVNALLNKNSGLQPLQWMISNGNRIGADGLPLLSGRDIAEPDWKPSELLQPYDDTAIDQNKKFAIAQTGHGCLMLVATKDLNGRNIRWTGLYNLLKGSRRSLVEANSSQWIEIPGIGKRPVVLFMVMVIVFVVISGPVLFTILIFRKQRNLYWVTLPCCSFLASASVFIYVLSTDGVGLQGASTGTYLVDQRSGFTTRFLNHSLYATSIPGGEINWSESARINIDSETRKRPSFDVVYRDDGRFAVRGESVASRSVLYFFESDTQQRTSGIQLINDADLEPGSKEPLRATNLLGTDAEFIYVRDKYNQHWHATRCSADDSIVFERIELPDFKELLDFDRNEFKQRYPDVPSLFDAYQQFRVQATNFALSCDGPIYVALTDEAPQDHGPYEPVNWRIKKFMILGMLENNQN